MITYQLSKPTAMNKLIDIARHNKFAAAEVKKAETEQARLEILNQYGTPIPEGVARIYIAFEISYSRLTADPDNLNSCVKPILDGLVKSKVLKNDSLSYVAPTMFFSYFRAFPTNQSVIMNIFFSKQSYLSYVHNKLAEAS
jgi:hypothetical protein